MTNVAIALPRSPLHLAHAAYDLQLITADGSASAWAADPAAHRKPVRRHVEAVRPRACARPCWPCGAILEAWQHNRRLEFRGEFTQHTLMTPAFNPGPNPTASRRSTSVRWAR